MPEAAVARKNPEADYIAVQMRAADVIRARQIAAKVAEQVKAAEDALRAESTTTGIYEVLVNDAKVLVVPKVRRTFSVTKLAHLLVADLFTRCTKTTVDNGRLDALVATGFVSEAQRDDALEKAVPYLAIEISEPKE